MKKFIIIFLLLLSCSKKPAIYIIGIDIYDTSDGGEVYILNYSINGMYQSPAFNTLDDLNNFENHLKNL